MTQTATVLRSDIVIIGGGAGGLALAAGPGRKHAREAVLPIDRSAAHVGSRHCTRLPQARWMRTSCLRRRQAPVNAFGPGHRDVSARVDHLHRPEGADGPSIG